MVKSYEVTQATAGEKRYLETADAIYVDAYVKWVRLSPVAFI